MTLEWHETTEVDGATVREFTIHAPDRPITGVLWSGPIQSLARRLCVSGMGHRETGINAQSPGSPASLPGIMVISAVAGWPCPWSSTDWSWRPRLLLAGMEAGRHVRGNGAGLAFGPGDHR